MSAPEEFIDTLGAEIAESMKDPEYAAAFKAAEERHARLLERPCSEGNCVELYDPETGESDGGWGPVGCPCQNDRYLHTARHGGEAMSPEERELIVRMRDEAVANGDYPGALDLDALLHEEGTEDA